ncbi:hypothetical protein DDB_G0275419 [Dictyostelium discoideum AX4]|uniref:Zn-dependent hydrolase n=1 Tax=Dictyostelium discoideum TaxID=44689 RepID=Q553U0_DICDI|nr:hypothetical protein DDB_G0275419 [Dictyostelium discoideum AX4]EAL69775.2 hypothetical protein DDB_G0275419 [Dictyostelium discoideum AX4]|eukprot:XP_643691.2 hypothetical protein DDB_G0275419 [Dictyostelium discoideum AX4]
MKIIIFFIILLSLNLILAKEKFDFKKLINQYSVISLEKDISYLSKNDKLMIEILFNASKIVDDIFWKQTLGKSKQQFLVNYKDKDIREYCSINYGPWDRLNNDNSFIDGIGNKPPTLNFYPLDITEDEFDNFNNSLKKSSYTVLRRDNGQSKNLKCIWYNQEYKTEVMKISNLLMKASNYSSDKGFKEYLKKRSIALSNDQYYDSDITWMEMTNNPIEIVIGPIETYDDTFKGLKASFQSQLLIKDLVWSEKIKKYNSMLPELQENLPVEDKKYKSEKSGSSKGDMYVYDLIASYGSGNAGPKNIAINLPNDPKVQLDKGTRKIQIKNLMKAKFDEILMPIAKRVIDPTQLKHVTFENGFFENVMFHEISHGLGVKFLVDGSGTSVHQALEVYYSPLEEAKADILGIYFITYLAEHNLISNKDLMDNYVSYIAGIFRSVRFGSSNAHAKANTLNFNFLHKYGAFEKNSTTNYFSVNFNKMKLAIPKLVNHILVIQGNGNKKAAQSWINEMGTLNIEDIIIDYSGIPIDIVFKQGLNLLKF